MTSDFLLNELRTLHPDSEGWVFVAELRMGSGYGGLQEQRIDAWAIRAWSSQGQPNIRRAFEIKTTRSDMLVELRHPDKRWGAYAISHEFYFVTPADLVAPALLTHDDGLLEWNGERLVVKKSPRIRESMPPRWDFVCSLARRVQGMESLPVV